MDRVLVTGIGGNVGYGILKNIRSAYNAISIIGTNTESVSPGNHLCGEVYKVPFSTDSSYMDVIKGICKKHGIKLIIPSTDYETFVLSSNSRQLPPVAVSPPETCKMFLDKYLTYLKFKEAGLPFAESVLPSSYSGQFGECLVKPREGRGSRGLYFNPPNPHEFSDEYLVQPLLKGKEITTAFYVKRNGDLHGMITFDRNLLAGATQSCEVTDDYDSELKKYIDKLTGHIPIRGACNLQSIVTSSGIISFEVNCRISGTNSIRSQFGFKDVSYTIDEYLYNKEPEPVKVTKGAAIRILSDIIYPGIKLEDVKNGSDKFYIYA